MSLHREPWQHLRLLLILCGSAMASSFCNRCQELGLSECWSRISSAVAERDLRGISSDIVDTVVQRTMFDEEAPTHYRACIACDELESARLDGLMVTAIQDPPLSSSTIYLSLECALVRNGDGGDVQECLIPVTQSSGLRIVSATQVDYDHLRKLLITCIAKHENCKPRQAPELASIMLIDVFNNKPVPYPCNRSCQYIALSYVWGKVQTRNLEFGSLPVHVPATISDAIKVTKALGCQYLWVDAICIDQQHSAHRDLQIRPMNQIFGEALATIIASHSHDARSSLPRVTSHTEVSQYVVKFGHNQLASILPPLKKQLKDCPWVKRG